MELVRQRHANGCGVAVLAMLTGENYETIRAEIDGQDGHAHSGDWDAEGVTCLTVTRLLVEKGFYLQRVYPGWEVFDHWPPEPWADRHFASVVQPSGRSHFVAMDGQGRVFDPLRDGTFALHDWDEVSNVTTLIPGPPMKFPGPLLASASP